MIYGKRREKEESVCLTNDVQLGIFLLVLIFAVLSNIAFFGIRTKCRGLYIYLAHNNAMLSARLD
jgi:hypothetical protein